MPDITVDLARNDADYDAARGLCREWRDWHWAAFPKDGPRDGNPLDPVTFQAVIDDLPRIHARPRGAIVLAKVDGTAMGCVMYHELTPDVAEIKRLFVRPGGQGLGLGRLLLERMFASMRQDGYRNVHFSSARFLTHARRLYESVGFHDIPHPDGFPDTLRGFVYFMERSLD